MTAQATPARNPTVFRIIEARTVRSNVLYFRDSPLNPTGIVLARYLVRRRCRVVFNNPFGSFHDTVAEAKREREQLDRLLTISTPRERLLVAAVALWLFIFVTWLFLGNVTRSLAVDGVLVDPGTNLSEAGRSVQALVWIESDVVPQIRAGMPAVLELGATDGEAGRMSVEVAAVSAVRLSEVPAALESAVPVSVHRLDIALDESFDLASIVGRECRIVIEVGTQSPIALLRTGRS